ncbi:hypothetical protein GH721_18530 [Kriegella sp. EG-1]|nr:hypothetical protein [Flavobacteriaceae bacterium EG-1]
MFRINFALLFFCLGLFTTKAQMNFKYHKIGDEGNLLGQVSLTDIDNDGDLDFAYGSRGEMYWYEFVSTSEWIKHEIGKGAITDVGGCAIDINGDNWIDFVAGDSWYENTGNPKNEHFILHKKNMIDSHDNIAVDIDNDGIKDIVAVSNNPDHPVLAWYKIPENHTENWDYHKIGKGIHGGISPKGYADLDQDGDIDIVCGNIWYENLNSDGNNWKAHNVLIPNGGNRPDKYGLALKTWCIDLNNDGNLDIVQSEADTGDGRIFWWENKNKSEEFIYHAISENTTNQDFHSLALSDFDGDGDIDVISGGGPLSKDVKKLFIWENTKGDGSKWKKHQLLEGTEIHELVAADVDGDGDTDIFSKPWKQDEHFFLENKLIK